MTVCISHLSTILLTKMLKKYTKTKKEHLGLMVISSDETQLPTEYKTFFSDF